MEVYQSTSRVNCGQANEVTSPLEGYFVIFFASALTLAQRFFAAFPIFALATAESTRLVPFLTCLSADCPIASAAALIPFSLCCIDASCFSSLYSSRLIADRISMNPPTWNLSQSGGH